MDLNGRMACQPCPAWCDGNEEPPSFAEDGFWHYSPSVTVNVTHGRDAVIAPEVLEANIKAWVPHRAAKPQAPLIGLSLSREEGPNLTLAEARQLARILLQLSDQAEAGSKPSRPNAEHKQ